MSSIPNTNDASILRKFELSKKEENLKNKLFGKSNSQKKSSPTKTKIPPPTTTTTATTIGFNSINQEKIPIQTLQKQDVSINPKNNQIQGNNGVTMTVQADNMLDTFLKEMENEFKELNKKQVTMGMLNNQTQLLKQHTEILNENQKNIAQLITKGPFNNRQQPTNQQIPQDQQKQLLKEIINPINNQIIDIKKIYEQTKGLAEEVANSVSAYKKMLESNPGASNDTVPKNFQKTFSDYQQANSNLKEMVASTQGDLNHLMPENMHILKQISNLNIQAYTECISSLKKQIEGLQKDAEKAEKELQARYQKIASMPKKTKTIKPDDPYYQVVENGPEPTEEIVKTIQNIDFITSNKLVINKLGGEFDYEAFIDDVTSTSTTIRKIFDDMSTELESFNIEIPNPLILDENEKNLISLANGPSILDELKAKYNIPKKMPSASTGQSYKYTVPEPMKQPVHWSQDKSNAFPIDFFGGNKAGIPSPTMIKSKPKHIKPSALNNLKTNPNPCLPDIEFKKANEKKKNTEFQPIEPYMKNTVEIQANVPVQAKVQKATKVVQTNDNNMSMLHESFSKRDQSDAGDNDNVVYVSLSKNDKAKVDQRVDKKDDLDAPNPSIVQEKPDILVDKYIENVVLENIRQQILNNKPEAMKITRNENEDDLESSDDALQRALKNPNSASYMRSRHYQQSTQSNPMAPYVDLQYENEIRKKGMIDNDGDSILKQLTMQVLAEKLPKILIEDQQKEKKKQNEEEDLFKPVKTIQPLHEKEPLSSTSQQQQQNNLNNLMNGQLLNPEQLGSAIAENLLSVFNNAMLQINGSLTKNMPQVIELLNKDKPPNLFSKKDNQQGASSLADPLNKKPEVIIEDEKPLLPKDKKLDKLHEEEKKTIEENEFLKQMRYASVPNTFMSPGPGLSRGGLGDNLGDNPLYFLNNEPKPILNLSEFMKELHTDVSSGPSDIDNTGSKVPSSKNFTNGMSESYKRDWEVNSVASKSEGQITIPPFDQTLHTNTDDDAPKFGKKLPLKFDMSDLGDLSENTINSNKNGKSTIKSLLTDNLFKSMNDDDASEGEIQLGSIFKV